MPERPSQQSRHKVYSETGSLAEEEQNWTSVSGSSARSYGSWSGATVGKWKFGFCIDKIEKNWGIYVRESMSRLDLAVIDQSVAVHFESWLSKGLFVAELCLVCSADALVAADAEGAMDDAVVEEPD